jgi:hypothetical protein
MHQVATVQAEVQCRRLDLDLRVRVDGTVAQYITKKWTGMVVWYDPNQRRLELQNSTSYGECVPFFFEGCNR